MKIGVIADDFTGASDIALTLSEAGMRVAQFIDTPRDPADPALEAGVISLKSRTAPVDEAVRASLAACDWLLQQGARQIVFKVCSTFDSTPKGNIGPVLDALADGLQAQATIVCPAFPENGRSVYQGHLFVQDVLLNECGMEDHPLTPMTDPDLRRVLAAQSTRPIGHVPAATVMAGADAIRAALPGNGHVIVDAIRDADLVQIGAAAKGAPLVCGGSGIALGLPANFGAQPKTAEWVPITGPGVVLSGSCSRATREQVKLYQAHAEAMEISAEDAISGTANVHAIADWVCAQTTPPLVYSSADPQIVKDAQARFGQDRAAHALETLFAELAAELARRGVRRFLVAGGETSGAVVQGLGVSAFTIGPRLAAGVPALRVEGSDPIALALKSGNFGGPTFFKDALDILEGQI
ncbi:MULTISPECIES: 3-oxo-tetronate kinase [unclassified Ruegeria]|uniref:3-oxo-tetronate kinase n=1 Tax=unclassified Ruegeria TaxID=2625375 RepID=UPI0014878FF6|nr:MULTISPECIES: 3-oxo-tetronate kinase [unclassified Ruegeria]